MIMQYTIILESSDDKGYIARCVEVPGVVGYGGTKGDAISRVREAIAHVQKTWNEELHDVIPAVGSEVIRIDVADAA